MEQLSDTWVSVLAGGPQPAARHIWRFLSGEIIEDAEQSSTPEYVADLYATLMSDSQRSCLRDAVTLALITHQNGAAESADIYIDLTSLASDIDLLSIRSSRSEDRLWASVRTSDEFSPQVSSLLSLLGAEGSIRPVDEWNEVYSLFGPDSAAACVEGVRRHGVLEVLHWMHDALDDSVRDGLMPAWLPILVQEDIPAIASLLRNPRGDREMSLRSMLPKWLSRYDISLPAQYREPAIGVRERPAVATATQLTVGFADYVALDGEGRSPAEVAAIWATVENAAPWPPILQSEGHADA